MSCIKRIVRENPRIAAALCCYYYSLSRAVAEFSTTSIFILGLMRMHASVEASVSTLELLVPTVVGAGFGLTGFLSAKGFQGPKIYKHLHSAMGLTYHSPRSGRAGCSAQIWAYVYLLCATVIPLRNLYLQASSVKALLMHSAKPLVLLPWWVAGLLAILSLVFDFTFNLLTDTAGGWQEITDQPLTDKLKPFVSSCLSRRCLSRLAFFGLFSHVIQHAAQLALLAASLIVQHHGSIPLCVLIAVSSLGALVYAVPWNYFQTRFFELVECMDNISALFSDSSQAVLQGEGGSTFSAEDGALIQKKLKATQSWLHGTEDAFATFLPSLTWVYLLGAESTHAVKAVYALSVCVFVGSTMGAYWSEVHESVENVQDAIVQGESPNMHVPRWMSSCV